MNWKLILILVVIHLRTCLLKECEIIEFGWFLNVFCLLPMSNTDVCYYKGTSAYLIFGQNIGPEINQKWTVNFLPMRIEIGGVITSSSHLLSHSHLSTFFGFFGWPSVCVMGAALPANVSFFILVGTILYTKCYDIDPLIAAYCQVRCLNQSNNDADCIFPCDVNITSHDECDEICHNKNNTCLNSCNFMWNLLSSGESVECLGQGQKNLPITNDMSIREIKNGRGIVHISWPHPNENVIFVVQTRWNLVEADNFTNWDTLTKTTASTIILKEVLYPGRWYQFRIAIVSVNGTDGFSEESKPFILSLSPKAPGPPTNLREETEDNQYPTLRWEPPFSELPIDHYRVLWFQRSPNIRKKQVSPKEFRRLLPSNRLSVTLKQVEPKALFLVQIQAVSKFRNHSLLGEKASIFVNTFSLKISDAKSFSGKISNLTVFQPNEIHNETFMQVNVSWNWPQELQKQAIKFVVRWNVVLCKNKRLNSKDVYYHSAVTEISFFTLSNLLLGCKYKVSVQPTKRGNIGEVSTCHFTLPCSSCDVYSNATSLNLIHRLQLIFLLFFIHLYKY